MQVADQCSSSGLFPYLFFFSFSGCADLSVTVTALEHNGGAWHESSAVERQHCDFWSCNGIVDYANLAVQLRTALHSRGAKMVTSEERRGGRCVAESGV